MPSVLNPVLADEDLNRHWDLGQHANFRSMIHKYRGWIDEAFAEPDRDESVHKWRKVFGAEFGRSAGTRRETTAAPAVRANALADLVPAVAAGRLDLSAIRCGRTSSDRRFRRPPRSPPGSGWRGGVRRRNPR